MTTTDTKSPQKSKFLAAMAEAVTEASASLTAMRDGAAFEFDSWVEEFVDLQQSYERWKTDRRRNRRGRITDRITDRMAACELADNDDDLNAADVDDELCDRLEVLSELRPEIEDALNVLDESMRDLRELLDKAARACVPLVPTPLAGTRPLRGCEERLT